MSINYLISIGLYISGIIVFAIFKYPGVKTIINTDVRKEYNDMFDNECIWPIIVALMNIVHVIACCIWPLYVITGLANKIKSTLKKS